MFGQVFDKRFTINFLSLLTVWLDLIFVDLELTLAVTLVQPDEG